MNTILTKEDFIDLFHELDIKKGDLVCLQANLAKFHRVVNGYQTVFDALFEVIGEQGCIMMPSFSYMSLDPACQDIYYEYEDWNRIRNEMNGYTISLSGSDIYSDCASQFMRNKEVFRSNHPVYNFLFKGNYSMDWLKQPMNYPISFSHVLKGFVQRRACNVVIGDELENSILLPAIAKTINKGHTCAQRAYIHSNKKTIKKTYLNILCDENNKKDLLEYCYCKEVNFCFQNVYSLTIEKGI